MTQPAPRLTSVPNHRVSSPRLKIRKAPSQMGVVDQMRFALRPRSRFGFALGLLLGGFVPVATYVLAHTELDASRPLYKQTSLLFVLGGLLFSAVTMYRWGCQAFHSKPKAIGFVLLLEGVMITCHTHSLALVALTYLAAINGVATACNLSGDPCTP
jgi:hypothetical protein